MKTAELAKAKSFRSAFGEYQVDTINFQKQTLAQMPKSADQQTHTIDLSMDSWLSRYRPPVRTLLENIPDFSKANLFLLKFCCNDRKLMF